MIKLPRFLLRASLVVALPMAANAAGTYYTGNYQSPQTRYSTQSYASRYNNTTQSRNYNTAGSSYASYSSSRPTVGTRTTQTTVARGQTQNTSQFATSGAKKQGFWLDAGISHEVAQWQFEMKESKSILHYDNIGWNVLDVRGGYAFNAGKTKMQIDAGFKYGMQSGDSTMVDDDITNGGYISDIFFVDANGNGQYDEGEEITGTQDSHALSVGKSSGGNMYGFNAGFGLTDFFQVGAVKFTPSIGYRYLRYKLETKNNHGLAVDSYTCFNINGEMQCDPILIFPMDSISSVPTRDNPYNYIQIPTGATKVNTAGTFYYSQPSVSHSYEVEWSGPYLALDMDYQINNKNSVNGRFELGLPGYTSTGDQPYRYDWAHPKSVEDKASIGSAYHLGLGANWLTALTNTVFLSLGLTYDYYTVSEADAKTYLNANYYETELSRIKNGGTYTVNGYEVNYGTGFSTDEAMLAGSAAARSIMALKDSCPGWACSVKSEIKSFYKSMGIRVGVNAKF